MWRAWAVSTMGPSLVLAVSSSEETPQGTVCCTAVLQQVAAQAWAGRGFESASTRPGARLPGGWEATVALELAMLYISTGPATCRSPPAGLNGS